MIIIALVFLLLMLAIATIALSKFSLKVFKVSKNKYILFVLPTLPITATIIIMIFVVNGLTNNLTDNLKYASLLPEPTLEDINEYQVGNKNTTYTDKPILIKQFITPRFEDQALYNNVAMQLASHFIYKIGDKQIDFLKLVVDSEVVMQFTLEMDKKTLDSFEKVKVDNINETIKDIRLITKIASLLLCLFALSIMYLGYVYLIRKAKGDI